MECKRYLEQGIENGDRVLIESALDLAEKLIPEWGDIITPVQREQAEKTLRIIKEEEESLASVKEALSTGKICGKVGELLCDSISVESIDKALLHHEQTDAVTKAGQRLIQSAKHVRALRASVLQAMEQNSAWEHVEDALKNALLAKCKGELSRDVHDEVTLLLMEVLNKREEERVTEALSRGAAKGSAASLALQSVEFQHLNPFVEEYNFRQRRGDVALEDLLGDDNEDAKDFEYSFLRSKGIAAQDIDLSSQTFQRLQRSDSAQPFTTRKRQSVLERSKQQSMPISKYVENLYKLTEVTLRLRKAEYQKDWQGIRRVVKEAQNLSTPPFLEHEFQLALEVYNNHVVVNTLVDALKEGGAGGNVGDLDVTVIDKFKLSSALEKVKEYHTNSEKVNSLKELANIVLDVRTAMIDDECETLEEIVERTSGIPDGHIPEETKQELDMARKEAQNIRILEKLNTALSHGGPKGRVGALDVDKIDVKGLQEAIRHAEKLECITEEAKWLQEVAEGMIEIRYAMRDRKWDNLQSLILSVNALDHCTTHLGNPEDFKGTRAPRIRSMSVTPSSVRLSGFQGGLERLSRVDGMQRRSKRGTALFGHHPKGIGIDEASEYPTDQGYEEKHDFRLPLAVRWELQAVQHELDNKKIIDSLKEGLSHGKCSGAIGALLEEGVVDDTRLREAVDTANNLGPKTDEAHALLHSASIILKLRRGVKTNDFDQVREVLAQCPNVGPPHEDPSLKALFSRSPISTPQGKGTHSELVPEALEEAERVRQEADYRLTIATFREALQEGNVAGEVGNLDTYHVDTSKLATAIDMAREINADTPEAEYMLELGRRIWQLRNAVLDEHWYAIESIAESCVSCIQTNPSLVPEEASREIYLVEEEVRNRRVVTALKDSLYEGRPEGEIGRLNLAAIDVQPLEDAMGLTLDIGLTTKEARCLVATCVHVRSLRITLMGGSWDRLGRLLAYAQAVIKHGTGDSYITVEDEDGGRPTHPSGEMGQWKVLDEYTEAVAQAAKQVVSQDATIMDSAFESFVFDIWKDGLAADAVPEIEVMQAELDNRNVIVQLTKALYEGAIQGAIGNINYENIDTSGLEWAISYANKMGCITGEARQLLRSAEVIKRLRQAVSSEQWSQVQQVLRDAKSTVLADLVAPEINLVQDELSNRTVLNELTAAMSKGRPTGEIGRLYDGNIDTKRLVQAIEYAENIGCKTEEAEVMLSTARVVLRLRQHVLNKDYKGAAHCLDELRNQPVATVALGEIKSYQDEIDNWVVISLLNAALSSNQIGGDPGELDISHVSTDRLVKAIKRVQEIGFRTDNGRRLYQFSKLVLELRRAVLEGDWERIRETLDDCEVDSAPDSCRNEIELCRAELDDRWITSLFTTALSSGGPEGEVGNMDTSCMDVSILDEAIATALEKGTSTKKSSDLLEAGKTMRRLRSIVKAEKWELVGKALREARENKDLFPLASLKELQLVQDEYDNRSVAEALRDAMSSGGPRGSADNLEIEDVVETGKLDEAISYARTLGCLTEETKLLKKSAEILRSLRHALLANDFEQAKAVLNEQIDQAIVSEAEDEVELVDDAIRCWVTLRNLNQAIASGRVTGTPGMLDTDTVDTNALEEAVRYAERSNTTASSTRRCLHSARHLLTLRSLFRNHDWQKLRETLNGLKADVDVTAAVREEAELIEQDLTIRQACENLRKAYGTGDEELLHSALSEAQTLELATHSSATVRSLVEKVQGEVSHVQHVRQKIEDANYRRDAGALQEALDQSRQMTFSDSLVDTAENTLHRIREVNENARKAIRRVDSLALEQAKEQFDGEGLENQYYQEVVSLLELNEGDFLRKALSAAVEEKDTERVISITMRLKEMFFQEIHQEYGEGNEDPFALWNFPKLKDPIALVAGSPRSPSAHSFPKTTKETVCWQQEPIKTSLTNLSDPYTRRLAVKTFRSILAFMGERNSSRPCELASELIEICIENIGLRDECFLQICKQLTGNPSSASLARGWVLLHVVLQHLPPTEDAENYIENFIRTQGSRKCLRALHLSLYNGSASIPPSAAEIESALNASNAPSLPIIVRSPRNDSPTNGHSSADQQRSTHETHQQKLPEPSPLSTKSGNTSLNRRTTKTPPPPPPRPEDGRAYWDDKSSKTPQAGGGTRNNKSDRLKALNESLSRY
eukprot:gb/GECG01016122.1/.p1 GENE.gb/GECG01016122.1/~~gb/GECG01016122.1/.p1  ORF type:complete len:2167 (+),score=323.76 gb/GECG01016122.1/:1-6501(+)